jgi:glycosyltransferase involved in cell wall biosynthesis
MEDSFGWHYFVQRKCLFPVVMRLHGPYLLVNQEECLSLKNKFRMKREQRAFQAARYVTSPSNDVLKKIERNYGQHWLLSRTIVNSISPEPRHRCWNLEEAEKHQILFVGRFDKTKGADVLLEAFFKVSAIYPAAKLFFIGPDIGIIKNGKKYNIEEYLEINNHSNGKVIYLGKQDQDTILKYRKSSHLTVVSSRYETFGNVVLEAFAIGSPLVCSDVGGLPEIVNDEVSGLIFESQNTQDLSNKILSLFRNDQLCKSIAQGGYLRVLDAYSPIVVAKELVEFFDQSVALQSDLDVRR